MLFPKKKPVRWSHPHKTKPDLDLDLNRNISFVMCTEDLEKCVTCHDDPHHYFELVHLVRCKH